MNDYWPWWAGALGLAAVAVGYWLAVGRTVGVSGAWDRVLHWREERAAELADAAFDEEAFEAALAAATEEEFGVSAAGGGTAVRTTATAAAPPAPVAPPPPAPAAAPVPLVAHAALLVSIFVGGLIAAVVSGRFELRGDMGAAYASLVVDGWLMWPVLFLGGILVGFGTRLAGGCSSGHGLSGCSRLQPASIIATAVFFGTGVAVSFLLWKVI
jgi:uncharacterized membrane protein YedE/YeeE